MLSVSGTSTATGSPGRGGRRRLSRAGATVIGAAPTVPTAVLSEAAWATGRGGRDLPRGRHGRAGRPGGSTASARASPARGRTTAAVAARSPGPAAASSGRRPGAVASRAPVPARLTKSAAEDVDPAFAGREPTSVRRATEWTHEVENAWRLQRTGWRHMDEYRCANGRPSAWSNGLVACLKLKTTGGWVYFRSARELEQKRVASVRVYTFE